MTEQQQEEQLSSSLSSSIPTIDIGPLLELIEKQRQRKDDCNYDNDDDESSIIINRIVNEIKHACCHYGFFQIINHSISYTLIKEFQQQMKEYFDSSSNNTDDNINKKWKRRSQCNSRGYFDNEYTKQKLDWKRCFDFGIPGGNRLIPSWEMNTNFTTGTRSNLSSSSTTDNYNNLHSSINDLHVTTNNNDNTNTNTNTENNLQKNTENDNDDDNYGCLDGYNLFPDISILPKFRTIVIQYYNECTKLSHILASLMTKGINSNYTINFNLTNSKTIIESNLELTTPVTTTIIEEMYQNHTSYLRLNYYPIICTSNENNDTNNTLDILGISPHRDAGFLTILLQDDDCHSLQVLKSKSNSNNTSNNSSTKEEDDEWITIHPLQGSLTINTGDMAQVYSNGLYKAPLHRVITNTNKVRYSAPYFYNPPYTTYVRPYHPSTSNSNTTSTSTTSSLTNGNGSYNSSSTTTTMTDDLYYPILWGYFRAVRFAGDLTNIGVEIQINDFEIPKNTTKKQILKSVSSDDENDNNTTTTTIDNNDTSMTDTDTVAIVNPHLHRQEQFVKIINFNESFSVEKYRSLLTS